MTRVFFVATRRNRNRRVPRKHHLYNDDFVSSLALFLLVCSDGTFRHTMEGDDDMPGHVKSSMMGVSLNIPIRNGRLALGTWQGVYLNEHRDAGGWGRSKQIGLLVEMFDSLSSLVLTTCG